MKTKPGQFETIALLFVVAFFLFCVGSNAAAQSCSSAPSEALSLQLSGGASTQFSWLTPADPGGTQTVAYDILRSPTASGFLSGTCVASGVTVLNGSDATVPSPIFYYLVRAKNGCGGSLGVDSAATPRSGASCLFGGGSACLYDNECTGGGCCSGLCTDLSNDTGNCGACGTTCVNPHGTTACSAATCVPTCAAGFGDCSGGPNDGCETPTANDIQHCGSCAAVCPGVNLSTCDASCSGTTCGLTCRGENYDVDANPFDGCEVLDSPTGNHTTGTATAQGARSCNDSDTFSFSGKMINDGLVHTNPAVVGFDAATGSAPDYSSIQATGGTFCSNDLSVTFQTSGGAGGVCYKLTVNTSAVTKICTTTGSSSCVISQGSGAYSDNTTILFKVERTCSGPPGQVVNYLISGHL